MLHRVKFDEKVKRFLNGQMTPSEEIHFKHELLSDPDKIIRAQIICFQMREEACFKISNLDFYKKVAALESMITLYDATHVDSNEEFDASVDLFMKNNMTPEEELSFMDKLDSSDQSRERAQFIALTIESMLNEGKEDDQRIIEAIKDTDMDDLISLLDEPILTEEKTAAMILYSDLDEDGGEDDKKDGKKDDDDLDIAAWY